MRIVYDNEFKQLMTMKTKQFLKTLLALLFLITVPPIFAQSIFKLNTHTSNYIDNALIECIYNYTANLPLLNSQTNEKLVETYTTILQANGSTSKFWDWNSFKKDSIIYSSANLPVDSLKELKEKYYTTVRYLFMPVVLKNYPKEKITVTDNMNLEDYIYVENKVDRKWALQEGTLTVCGYECNKAVASFGGREWTVWYTPEITISDGPWKFYGLPGLILKASDATGIHTFEAIAIRKSNRPIYLDKNFAQIKTGRDKFITNKNRFEKDPLKNIHIGEAKSVAVLKETDLMLINGKRTSARMNKKGINCPLELE
jgi:GLPGLI family protein